MDADYAAQIAVGHVFVATDDGWVQGFVVFHAQGRHMLLENVAVHPRAARRGIGKSLIGFCEAEARRRGLMAVDLYTNAAMADNLSIYPRLGYHEVGRRQEDGFHRVYFTKPLA